MRLKRTKIPECFLVVPEIKIDRRGRFVKSYSAPDFEKAGVRVQWKESFYTVSKKNVLRGLHFQRPPADHHKLVTCVKGEILDVLVDLRKGSPAFGRPYSFRLSETNGHQLFIPKGLAHGFVALTNDATVIYSTTHPYSPKHDTGILWDSVKFRWPVARPIISERDRSFVPLSNFDSPFKFSS